jgi:hypothetical protein
MTSSSSRKLVSSRSVPSSISKTVDTYHSEIRWIIFKMVSHRVKLDLPTSDATTVE